MQEIFEGAGDGIFVGGRGHPWRPGLSSGTDCQLVDVAQAAEPAGLESGTRWQPVPRGQSHPQSHHEQNTSPLAEQISRTLHDSQDTAAIALLLSLLRQTPGLRQWLHIVAHDKSASRRLNAVVSGKLQPSPPHNAGRALLAWIASPATAVEHQKQPANNTDNARRRYGGLTRSQVIGYIRRCQSGTIGLATFLIACEWRRCPPEADPSPALLQATALLLKRAITLDAPDLMRHFTKTASFFHTVPIGKIARDRFGYPNWWKLVLFQYILANPKPRYKVREFQQHLRSQKLCIEDKHLRRFCIKHRIARDTRPGRPRRGS